MDRIVKPSRRKTLIRRSLRYGTPVAIVLTLIVGWRLIPVSGTLSVSSDQLSFETVRTAPFLDYLPVRATVTPLHVTFIDAVQGGSVAEIIARDGALVQKGDMLAYLTNPQLQLDVISREAQIASQLGVNSGQRLTLQQTRTTEETQLAEARYSLLKTQRELYIREQLRSQGFESDANVQSYRDEAEYYAQRLKRLENALTQDLKIADKQSKEIDEEAQRLRSNLDAVKASLNALILRAPLTGRLTNFDLQPGQSLKAGDRIGQIDSEKQYRLDADIDEFYLGRIFVKEHAEADLGNVKIPMTVSRVHPQVTKGQFRAELTFDAVPPDTLHRGESIDLRITLGETRQALVLPNGAWLEDSGGLSAFVVSANGHSAHRIAITSGRRNPDQVEITSGLHEGDRVITSSYKTYKNFNHLSIH
ncbi:efflux RND transporter periplasmic adaptor subunit [Saccharibacter sp. 17.LH.SD]|nr:efflux RND transporter periplasmic adaptor subunit [Saccharibacter sp. 17.LH.SD]